MSNRNNKPISVSISIDLLAQFDALLALDQFGPSRSATISRLIAEHVQSHEAGYTYGWQKQGSYDRIIKAHPVLARYTSIFIGTPDDIGRLPESPLSLLIGYTDWSAVADEIADYADSMEGK